MMKLLELIKMMKLRRLFSFNKPSDSSSHAGFTLLEMVVSFGIFAILIVAAFGAVLTINKTQQKATQIQNIEDNLRFALESMAREMRFGSTFQPSGGSSPAYAELTFTRRDRSVVGYCLANNAVMQLTGGGTNCGLGSPVTDDSITIDQLIFYVVPWTPGTTQPRITIALQAHSRDPNLATMLNLQTTVTPRLRGQ